MVQGAPGRPRAPHAAPGCPTVGPTLSRPRLSQAQHPSKAAPTAHPTLDAPRCQSLPSFILHRSFLPQTAFELTAFGSERSAEEAEPVYPPRYVSYLAGVSSRTFMNSFMKLFSKNHAMMLCMVLLRTPPLLELQNCGMQETQKKPTFLESKCCFP